MHIIRHVQIDTFKGTVWHTCTHIYRHKSTHNTHNSYLHTYTHTNIHTHTLTYTHDTHKACMHLRAHFTRASTPLCINSQALTLFGTPAWSLDVSCWQKLKSAGQEMNVVTGLVASSQLGLKFLVCFRNSFAQPPASIKPALLVASSLYPLPLPSQGRADIFCQGCVSSG
jgi:hypothetical protein